MSTFVNFFKHLHTVNEHRFLVCRNCFKMGLYWQGLTHDLSKYSPAEFWTSVKYFQGDRSPISAEIAEKGYSEAWLHHKGHNPHHWQYWIDQKGNQLVVNEPPLKYIKEMVADRVAACMVYQKDKYHPASAVEFMDNGFETPMMPPKMRETLHRYLTIVAQHEDLNEALRIIKEDRG